VRRMYMSFFGKIRTPG